MEHIAVGLGGEAARVLGSLNIYPEKIAKRWTRCNRWPAEGIVDSIRQTRSRESRRSGEKIAAIGIGFPGHHPRRPSVGRFSEPAPG